MKNVLKLGSIALALPFMLTPLGHAQQWSSEQSLGGVPTSLITPIQVPGTNVLQIFYAECTGQAQQQAFLLRSFI